MGRLDWRMLLCVALIASYFQASEQIFIKNQTVPQYVKTGEAYVILDCDYDLENTPIEGLYVKWWLNENTMVYQWIHGSRPQATAPVDKYIDLKYEATQDPTTKYRAMKLKEPGVDLTGDYTCTVSTMAAEDSATKPMIVFSTAIPKLNLKKTSVNGVDGVELTCVAEGLYPRPTLDVSIDDVRVEQRPLITQGTDKRFNITTRVELRDQDLQDPSKVICVLGIPEANITDSATQPYYPGPSTTTTTSSTTLQRKMDIQALDNSQRDTDNGGGSGASSISNGLNLVLVSVIAAIASRFQTIAY